MLIYKVTNTINNKIYIGQTVRTLKERKQEHLLSAKQGYKFKFYNAIRKYGEDVFTWEVIQYCSTVQELNEAEAYWVAYYDSYNNGYNMTPGGEFNPMLDKEIQRKHLAKVQSEEFRRKVSNTMKKYVSEHGFSEEHRQKISESMKGNTNFKGHKLSESHAKALQSSHYKKVIAFVNDKEVCRFNSVKEATKWYYDTFIPKERSYNYTSLADKIKKYSKGAKSDMNNVRWEYACVETIEKQL